MNRQLTFLLCCFCLLFFFSCKKKEKITPQGTSHSYFPMSKGSYWIYQWYQQTDNGSLNLMTNNIDTVSVIGDTIIRGLPYYQIESKYFSNQPQIQLRRDSLGYLVDPHNNIFFSSTNFVDTLHIFNSTSHRIHFWMEKRPNQIEVPVGNFEVLNYQGEVTPFITVDWDKRFKDNYYARGIGPVLQTEFFFSAPNLMERQLIEYHIE